MATKINLVIDQGSTFYTTLSLVDDNGDPVDLTNYTGAAQIRKHYSSSTATSFEVTVDEEGGTVSLALSANTSSNLVAGRYVYDVELTDPSDVVSRIFEGIVTVTPQVTR